LKLVHLFQHLGAAAKDDHMVATLVEGCRHRTPDAGAAAGHNCKSCLQEPEWYAFTQLGLPPAV
jgi:hypothetical protein